MGITASDGVNFELEDLDQTLTYNGDGTLNYIQVQYRGNTYRQTFTWVNGKNTAISRWVKQ